MKFQIQTVTFLLALGMVATTARAEEKKSCTTAREFITALEYLRDQKQFQLPEAQARKAAEEVAAGCTGAAKRFIRVTTLLANAGLASSDAVKTGIEFSRGTDANAATFTAVFQQAYLEDALDLDARTAMTLARSLSSQFDGDVEAARKDFASLVEYCTGESDHRFGLPKPQCAELSASLTRAGQGWKGGIAKPFIEIYEFLLSSRGPGLATGPALSLAREIIQAGPAAAENFIQGYRYASAKDGLELAERDAIRFARDLAFKGAASESEPSSKKQ